MLERLEDLLLSGIALPFTPYTLVHGDKLLPLLDRLRENLPEEVRAAQAMLERRDVVLEEAHSQAMQMLQEAKGRSEAMLSDSELLRAVEDEAGRVREQLLGELEALRNKAFEESEAMKSQAYQEALRIRQEAYQYAEALVAGLDGHLTHLHSQVKDANRQLRQLKPGQAEDASDKNRSDKTFASSPERSLREARRGGKPAAKPSLRQAISPTSSQASKAEADLLPL